MSTTEKSGQGKTPRPPRRELKSYFLRVIVALAVHGIGDIYRFFGREVTGALAKVEESARSVAESSGQIASAVQELANQAQILKDLTGHFRLRTAKGQRYLADDG